MKALLVYAWCLTCNSASVSVTVFDSMAECDAARSALVQHAKYTALFSEVLTFTDREPQCIPYVKPEIEP